MYKFVSALALLFVSLMFPSTSYAESMGGVDVWNLNVVGGMTLADPTGSNVLTNSSYNPQAGFAAGILADFYFNKQVSLELGAEYVSNSYSTSTLNYNSQGVEFPLLVRWWPIPYFSIGAGGYLQQYMGNINLSQGGMTSSPTYNSLNLSTTDVGLVGSAQVKFPITNQFNILLDTRFLYGLTDLNGLSTAAFYNRTFEFLGGFGISF